MSINLRRFLPVFILVAAALLLRFLTQTGSLTNWWVNVSPVMALCFVGGALLPRSNRWVIFIGLIAVDFLAAGSGLFRYFAVLLVTYSAYVLAIVWGGSLRGRATGFGLLARVLAVSLGFYLVTNTASWALSAGYAKTFGGWMQALTVGLPGFPPTWVFLRNSLVSDLGFGVLLIVAHNLGQERSASARALGDRGLGFVPWLRSQDRLHSNDSSLSSGSRV